MPVVITQLGLTARLAVSDGHRKLLAPAAWAAFAAAIAVLTMHDDALFIAHAVQRRLPAIHTLYAKWGALLEATIRPNIPGSARRYT